MSTRYAQELGRKVFLRHGCDEAIYDLVFSERAHVPPDWMPAPKTVLDLGANVGLTAAHYQAMWPEAKIVAVEMDMKNALMARQNFDGEIIQRAVTANGDGHMVRYDSNELPASYKISEGGNMTAPSVSLKVLIADLGGSVDFVKMDIEGEEWNIFLTDDWVPGVRYLMVEFHRDGADVLENGLDVLEHLGFHAKVHHAGRKAVFAWKE